MTKIEGPTVDMLRLVVFTVRNRAVRSVLALGPQLFELVHHSVDLLDLLVAQVFLLGDGLALGRGIRGIFHQESLSYSEHRGLDVCLREVRSMV